MASENQPTEQTQSSQHPISDRWHLFLRAYTKFNQLSHHLLSITLQLLAVLFLVLCVVFLVLRFVLVPQIGHYKPEIEHMLGAKLGRSVSINKIIGSWQGWRPHLEFQQVALRDEQGSTALTLPNVQITVSWLSLFIADIRLYKLEINQPELELRRHADGKIYIAGWWLDPTKKSDANALSWILSQRAIVINDGTIRWTDAWTNQQRAVPMLTLSHVNFIMRNRWQRHRFSLTATPPAYLAQPLDIRADFKHPPLSKNIADFLQWKGLLYASFSNADLAAWKSYLAYPFDVRQGTGDVRLWFKFDQARMVDITADLKLTDVSAKLEADLQPLDLKNVSGRISAQEIAPPTRIIEPAGLTDTSTATNTSAMATISERLRTNGHQITLTNFTFETLNGIRLPPTTLMERFTPATKNSATQFQFSAKFLDLTTLANLTDYFPLPEEYRTLLKTGQPAGQLSNFSVKLQGSYPEFSHYQITGKFTNLAMKSPPVNLEKKEASALLTGISAWSSLVPGFANLSGHIDMNEKKGSVQLASKNLLLQLPDYFPEPELKFDLLEMQANWLFQADKNLLVTLTKFNSTQQDMQAHFYGTHLFPTALKNQQKTKPGKTMLDEVLNGTVDLTGTISRIDIQKINRYLPVGTDANLRHWLTYGLQQGNLDNVSVRIKGNLPGFPFVKKSLLDQNIFHITGKIVDGKINYLPGVSGKEGADPYWPVLSKIQGQIVVDRESMEIHAESGETDRVAVAKVHARIPDLFSQQTVLEIDGTATGKAQEMVHYLSVSPVLGWIDNFTQDTTMSGNARLKLNLLIPLSHPLDTRVNGEVQLKDNDVALLKELPLLTQVNGRFTFNERGLNLNTLKGNFLGGAVTVTGGTQKDGVIRIRAKGQITADGIRKAYGQPELKNVLNRLDGKTPTPFSAVIEVKNKQTNVRVDSTLQGMASHLPAPLNKKAVDHLPLHVEVINTTSANATRGTGTHEYDEVTFSLGDVVNAHYFRQRESPAMAWKVTRGGIGINSAAPMPESGLSAHIDLASFNVDEVQALWPDKKTTLTNKVGDKDALQSGSGIDVSQYLEPDLLSVHATEVTLTGKKLNQVVLGATHSNGIWQANIDSKQIAGYLTWHNAGGSLGHSQTQVTARLKSLIIPEIIPVTTANDVVDLLQNKHVHSGMPGLDVIADNVELSGKKLGRLELKASNVNAQHDSAGNGWQIDTLSLTNPDAVLTAKGKWSNGGSSSIKNQTELNYQLGIINAGKLLDRLGYPHLIAGGKGKLNGEVSWNGSPYSIDIPSLSGNIRLDLQAGQFLKVDPGAAKLLSVLNMQSLPRRLVLDFRDVFSEGFSFDSITSEAEIEHGIARTDNFKMHSTSATVLLSGTANITNETQNLHVIVVPEVNVGAASILYGLAINPVIGAGTFLAQLFLRAPLMKAFTFQYQITGSWKEPNVVKSEDKAE